MPLAKNVVVFGSHGKIGQHLVRLLAKSGSYKATAVVRNQEQADTIAKVAGSASITPREFSFVGATVEQISSVIKGHDVVVFAVGSGGRDLLKVDLDAAVKTFEATELAQVRRLIIISALHAESRHRIESTPIQDYYITKHYADRILVNEFSKSLDYTILRPTTLTDDAGTGKIRFLPNVENPKTTIPREDVAKVLFEVIGIKDTYGKAYDFATGDLDVENALIFKQ